MAHSLLALAIVDPVALTGCGLAVQFAAAHAIQHWRAMPLGSRSRGRAGTVHTTSTAAFREGLRRLSHAKAMLDGCAT